MGVESISLILTQYSYVFNLLHLQNYLESAAAISDDVPKCPKNMSDILKAEKVIPDVIDNVPKYHIQIEYNQHCFIHFGNMLKSEEVYQRKFEIKWHCVKDTFFTLLLVGPDEPTPDAPIDGEFLYWLYVNIPTDTVSNGDCLVEYIAPEPQGIGVHRYVYIVLHQTKGKMEFDEPYLSNSSIHERKRWSTKAFMKNNGFKEVYAVNFFKSERTDLAITTKISA